MADQEQKPTEESFKKKNHSKTIIAILGTLLLALSVAVGILLVRQNQGFREKAATSTGTVKVFLSPETKTVAVGETFTANVLLDTAGNKISALTVYLSYPYSGDTPPVAATDIQINSDLIVNQNWNFPIKSVNTGEDLMEIRIGGLTSSSDGYQTTGETVIATISFKAQAAGSITVSFDPTMTKATNKTTGEDILLTPTSVGRYTVSGGEATAIPTASTTTPTISPTPIRAVTPTPSPIPAPQSGVSSPTLARIAGGITLIIGAILLSF